MLRSLTGDKTKVTYLVAYLLAIGAPLRYLGYILTLPARWIALGLLAAFLVLAAVEPWLSRRSHRHIHLYLAVQTCILIALSLITTIEDFFGIPFMSLILQSMNVFPARVGFRWIIVFAVITSVFVPIYGSIAHEFGVSESLPTVLIYLTVYFFAGSLIAIIDQVEIARKEAEIARKESKKLLTELQETHKQLRIYSERAEEVAVAQERSRLARELHDSVTQSLHSSTLLAEAGQRLIRSGDTERARRYLIRLGEISHQALKEMRLLVYELRPLALREVGLAGALRQRLDAVERRSGVEVQLSIGEELELPTSIEEELYRVAMEALNNALKHANPTRIKVSLGKEESGEMPCIELSIQDDGIGFDLDAKTDEGGLGLVSMKERIEQLGGELTILSTPGEGTQVRACVDVKTPKDSLKAQEA
jgi:signal transduction histidine kinase